MATQAGDVPSDLKAKLNEVFKVYTSKDGKEQGRLVQEHYREDAHFVDPIMDCKGQDEIALAFFSLIKLFSQVECTTKEFELQLTHQLPTQYQTGGYQQVQVHNQQVYRFERAGFLSSKLLPEVVDLDVTTTFILDPQTNKILHHQDQWRNKGFEMFRFLKRPNGAFSGGLFKLLGWKKDVFDNNQPPPKSEL